MIKNWKGKGILLVFILISALTMCSVVTAHPGHGTYIVEPSNTGGSSPSPGGSSSSSSSSGSSGYHGSSSSSGSSGSTSNPGTSSGGAQPQPTGAVDGQTDSSDNTETGTDVTGATETSTGSVDGNASGAMAAVIGLILVIGLIIMYFPYKGGTLSKLQARFFGIEK